MINTEDDARNEAPTTAATEQVQDQMDDQMENQDPTTQADAGDEAKPRKLLNDLEARVIACLMEKQLTVPDNYPLTLNSLLLACNQKSNREPVTNLAEGEVGRIANILRDRKMLSIEYGDRANRYQHTFDKFLEIDRQQQSLLTVLMLRTPQTLNELKTRTARMVDFADVEEIRLHLDLMAEHQPKLVQFIPRGPNQREDRYTHLLCGEVAIEEAQEASSQRTSSAQTRIDELEDALEQLQKRVARLEAAADIAAEQ